MSSDGNKTEPATPRQRQRARERGQVARSVELVSAALLMSSFLLLKNLGEHSGDLMGRYMASTLDSAGNQSISFDNAPLYFQAALYELALVLWPFLIITAGVAITANLLQVGLQFSTQPLSPNWGRLNPLSGAQRLFSMRGFVELGKALLKLILLGVVAFSILGAAFPTFIATIAMNPIDAMEFASGLGLRIGLTACGLLLIIAILDYMYQRFEFEKSIKMSKEEIKQEYKSQEGDPQVKRRLRDMGRKIAMSHMFEALKEADAVIVNPTHYAVALSYNPEWPAPKVVAKGKDYTALRIIRYAEEQQIPVYQQPELARSLYPTRLDDFIPNALFKAVAGILAQLSKTDEKLRRKLMGLRR